MCICIRDRNGLSFLLQDGLYKICNTPKLILANVLGPSKADFLTNVLLGLINNLDLYY